MRNREVIVHLPYERCYGKVVGPVGAHFTMIYYIKGAVEYEVLMENDDFEIMEDDLVEDG